MKNTIKLEAIPTSITSRADGSLRVSLSTSEMTKEDKVDVMELQNLPCDVLIKPQDYALKNIKKIKGSVEGKSLSQRLHNVLYVYWKQYTPSDNFDVFYMLYMESLINKVKDKLN